MRIILLFVERKKVLLAKSRQTSLYCILVQCKLNFCFAAISMSILPAGSYCFHSPNSIWPAFHTRVMLNLQQAFRKSGHNIKLLLWTHGNVGQSACAQRSSIPDLDFLWLATFPDDITPNYVRGCVWLCIFTFQHVRFVWRRKTQLCVPYVCVCVCLLSTP